MQSPFADPIYETIPFQPFKKRITLPSKRPPESEIRKLFKEYLNDREYSEKNSQSFFKKNT
jgi:hypothetical protein